MRGTTLTTGGGTTARAGTEFLVVVNDAAGNAVANSIVQINLSACTDVKLCNIAPTLTAGFTETINCPSKLVQATTNALGQARFIVMVGGLNNAAGVTTPAPGPGQNCGQIVGDGIPLCNFTLLVEDMNGANQLGSTAAGPPYTAINNGSDTADLSKFAIDLLTTVAGQTYKGRSDWSSQDANGCGGPAPDCGGGDISTADLSQFAAKVALSQLPAGGCASAAGEAAFGYCP